MSCGTPDEDVLLMDDGYSNKFATSFPPTSYRITYNYDNVKEFEFPQPQTSTIAHFSSTLSEDNHQSIDVSPSYIVYAVKNNLVRAIDRRNAQRTLLRGHSSPLSCLRFFKTKPNVVPSGSDVLGSVGGGPGGQRTVFIWRLFAPAENEISGEKLLEIRLDGARKMMWHPTNPNRFLIVTGSSRNMLIETTRLVTMTDSEGGHAVCLGNDGDLGNSMDIAKDDIIVDCDWNKENVHILMTALEKSEKVQFWDLSGWGSKIDCKSNLKVKDISSCFFVDHKKGTFITGSNRNIELVLWSSFSESPTQLQVFNFQSNLNTSFHVLMCDSYLLVADKHVGNLHTIKIKNDTFASFSPFSIKHPIVSWSLSTHFVSQEICLFCVQSKSVQMLLLKNNMLAAPSSFTNSFPPHIKVETKEDVLSSDSLPAHISNATNGDPLSSEQVADYEDDNGSNSEYDYEKDKDNFPPPPPPTALPPPGLEGTLPTNSFSNWLGSLATNSSAEVNNIKEPNSEETLLSPTEFLNNSESKATSSTPQLTEENPSPSKSNTLSPTKKSKPHSSPNRIRTILKREDPSVTTASNTNVSTNPLTINAIEDATRRILKKHEASLLTEIQRTVHSEIQTTLIPTFQRTLTQSLEECVTVPIKKSIKTKEISDELVQGVKDPIVDAFHQSMREIFIPAYEAATQQMFQQITTKLENTKITEDNSHNISALSQKMDSMAIALESLSVEVTHLRSLVSTFSPKSSAESSINVETTESTKDDILRLLSLQEYEQAFTKALSASSADLAVFSCKNANSQILFESGDTPSLSQPILLCLMQQLGSVLPTADTSDLMEVLSWLQDICVVLDPKNNSIEKHVGEVLRQLVNNINLKAAEGDMTFRRPLQMLLQVIRGIGNV